ncbi:aldose 1-epimerase family protein [Microbacterium sp. C7(2022)]|uniref:aldose 1-epimerase family protein n=1 Tax=Microbacterium sp. C7(2022) TaxID=2992759 RepID=UPI00237AC369|nr:aldose 1-epimerase family protein [Microbacterium sp. C7(2022)]MDE0546244.1 aldose 1-epimerase family protein [Microbacterium sp. C7(2022)]
MALTPASGTQHALRAGDYEAVIASVGATLRSLTYDGRDLVVPFEAAEVRPAHRGVTLAPWPNRVTDGRYTFGGVERQLALTEPARSHALHGLAVWLDYEAVDKGPSHVTLAASIPAQTAYPWRIAIRTTFELTAEGLTQTVVATNEGPDAAPFGTGPHPYLVAGPGKVDEWTLELPASEVLAVTDDRLIPTELRAVDADDAPRFDFRDARVIGAAEIDHAYTGLARDDSGDATVRVTVADGTGVAMSWNTSCAWVQVHTADKPEPAASRIGLAVEPMTCAPDAFNDANYSYDTGLIVLESGESTEASWRISAI